MIIPNCKPGQILIRTENDVWTCVWPEGNKLANGERYLIGFAVTVVMLLIGTAILLVVACR